MLYCEGPQNKQWVMSNVMYLLSIQHNFFDILYNLEVTLFIVDLTLELV